MAVGAGGRSPSDNEIEHRLRELTEEIAASRAKAAKEQAQQAKRQARQAVRQGRGDETGGSPRYRRAASFAAVIVMLAGGGFLAWSHHAPRFGSSVVGAPTATASETPSSSSSSGRGIQGLAPFAGPPADPFAGTPADHWADGAAGITVPVAGPAGTFTSAQVTAAFAMTRKLLIAQNLDPATLRGGKPTAFENLLIPRQLDQFLKGLDEVGLAKDGSPLATRAWVASFAPGSTDLVGTVIKAHGTMSARAGTLSGSTVLDIDVNYRFVYVVEPPGKPQDWMRIVGQVAGYVEFFNFQDPAGPLQPWIVSAFPSEAGDKCGTTDGFVHPDYPSGRGASAQPSGPAIDPYSMAIPRHVGACQPTTGT